MNVMWAVAAFCAGVFIALTGPTLGRGAVRTSARPRVRKGVFCAGLVITGFVASTIINLTRPGGAERHGATVLEFVVPRCEYPVAEAGCKPGVVASGEQKPVAEADAQEAAQPEPEPVADKDAGRSAPPETEAVTQEQNRPATTGVTKPLVREDAGRKENFDPLEPERPAPAKAKARVQVDPAQVSGPRPPSPPVP